MNAENVVKALIQDAAYAFEFDVTTGQLTEDIISSDGINYTRKAGLSAPCSFNELVTYYFGPAMNCRILSGSVIRDISNQVLLDAYFSGALRCEVPIFYPLTNQYYRNLFFFYILSNAIKYTSAGGSIHMSLEELPYEKEGYCLIQTMITDTGIGISPDFLSHIFENFAREKNSSLSGVYGAGLGLPVVKKLLELMGGTIHVESSPGKGTRVTVEIPHKIVEREELLRQTKYEEHISKHFIDGKRVLLAEDNDLNAEIAIMLLADAGFQCEWVEDGTEAVKAIQEHEEGYYDLVLMDIEMPNMNGYEAAIAIRSLTNKEKASIPIIAMTANAYEEDQREALASGMNGYIAKPMDIKVLIKELAKIFQITELHRNP